MSLSALTTWMPICKAHSTENWFAMIWLWPLCKSGYFNYRSDRPRFSRTKTWYLIRCLCFLGWISVSHSSYSWPKQLENSFEPSGSSFFLPTSFFIIWLSIFLYLSSSTYLRIIVWFSRMRSIYSYYRLFILAPLWKGLIVEFWFCRPLGSGTSFAKKISPKPPG